MVDDGSEGVDLLLLPDLLDLLVILVTLDLRSLCFPKTLYKKNQYLIIQSATQVNSTNSMNEEQRKI